MKNVMIVEDQKMIRSILEGYIDKAADLLLTASVEGAEQAYEICGTKKIHLILMDVQTAHRENGLAAVKRIKEVYPEIQIVVVTSLVDAGILEQAKSSGADSLWYKDTDEAMLMQVISHTMAGEHVFLDAFEVEAFQYVLKPVQPDKVFSLLERFQKEVDEERERYILLRVEGKIVKVLAKDVVYCEAQGKRQCIYMADGTEVLLNMTMAKLYEMCSVCQALVKVGASYIVHLEHINSLNAQEAQMDNGQKIFLPRGTYRCLRKQYFDYYVSSSTGSTSCEQYMSGAISRPT